MENQRVRLTKRIIAENLLSLMKHKELEAISVAELCREAAVNRTTFYKYYRCPEDVLRDMEKVNQNVYESLWCPDTPALERLTLALEHALCNIERACILNKETTKELYRNRAAKNPDDVFYVLLSADVPEAVRPYCRRMTSAAMTLWLDDPDRMGIPAFAKLLMSVSEVCKQACCG